METTQTEFYRPETGLVYVLNIGRLTCKVINSPTIKGDVVIPAKVNYKDKDYQVEAIGEAALKNNSGIKSVTFAPDSTINAIEKNAFEASSVESITFPASLTRIGDNAFAGCGKLQTVQFPNGSKLIAVGKDAFPAELLPKITFPNEVKQNGLVENLF